MPVAKKKPTGKTAKAKGGAASAATKPTAKPPAKPSVPPVRVRMFRQGLGDCFLLTFDPAGDPRHVLIDCGSLGAKTTGLGLKAVAQEIAETVKGRGLDLLVVTHEHWDHVAGFKPDAKLFDDIPIKRIWMAWTENPQDPDARQLSRKKEDLGAAFRLAVQALALAPNDARCAEALQAVTDLHEFESGPLAAAGSFSPTVNEAMHHVRTQLGAAPTYREPGDGPLQHDWLTGFRVYVLGPPRSTEKLMLLGDTGSTEIYGIAPGVVAATGSRNGQALGDEKPFVGYREFPLEGADARAWYPDYFEGSEEWRRIDGHWLHGAADAAERLGLQLDSMTNNTSLALAFERVADGKVLLFPADAQEGNWLSWHDANVSWNVLQPGGGTRTVRAADLLDRTVFYKVGHHSSHNATAKGKGLELMQGAGLTAFIPVDRQVALTRNPPGSWRMPARDLYRRLLEKCEGRVLRSDLGWAQPAEGLAAGDTEKAFEGLANPAEWQKWQQAQQAAGDHIRVTKTYVEYVLE